MKVTFESRDPDGAQMREVSVRRLRFVLRRLSWLVPRAKVQLSDVNGPKGGIDKRCHIELKTEKNGTVVVTSMAHDWHAALETALMRASRLVVRGLQRSRAQATGKASATLGTSARGSRRSSAANDPQLAH